MPHEVALVRLVYLLAAVLFIFGLKGMCHPRTAVMGNLLSALGMLIAVVITLTDNRIVGYGVIIAGFVVGGLVGVVTAYYSTMTAMPQVVAVLNAFGGGASALAVGAALEEALHGAWVEEITVQFTVSAALAALVGAVTFTGSFVAFGKLQGVITERPILVRGRHAINITLVVLCLGLTAWLCVDSMAVFEEPFQGSLTKGPVSSEVSGIFSKHGITLPADATLELERMSLNMEVENAEEVRTRKSQWLIHDKGNDTTYTLNLEGDTLSVSDSVSSLPFWLLVVFSSVLGVMLVIPIGGADMPVVISLLNAYSGIAAAGHGWVLNNSVLIVAGSLVGAAGFILTALMSKAMNRSLANIMFAGVGAVVSDEKESADVYAGKVKAASPEEVALLMEGARRVVIAPGYGMAVAQAQFAIADLTKALEARGVEVEFAIHPVAGRMPGHMNVLLADANISYDKLKEMDVINPTFRQTDVVLVIGANDVVNPLAREADPSIPIAGMPILDVDQAQTVVVIKRSLSPGFAGIANPLFAADNTLMLFGDAKQMALDLRAALG
jgi:NAD(P) transhydrogenase subunit beta